MHMTTIIFGRLLLLLILEPPVQSRRHENWSRKRVRTD